MARAEPSDVTFSQGGRMLFYLVSPNETSFSDVGAVPRYVEQATPFFVGLLLLEVFVGWLKTGNLLFKVNDGTTSLSAGMISRLPNLFVRSLEVSSYIYVWNNFRILELPWDSAWTWWLAFLGVDFGYYWVHRCSHDRGQREMTFSTWKTLIQLFCIFKIISSNGFAVLGSGGVHSLNWTRLTVTENDMYRKLHMPAGFL